MPYTIPDNPLAPSPEDFREWVEWHKKLGALTKLEASRRLGRGAANTTLLDPIHYESIILRYRMTEPRSYQCVNGHFVSSPDAFSQTHCEKCGNAVFMSCGCGASALLTYTYKPPYRTVNPAGHTGHRETCFNCGAIYPWTYSYISRPTDEPFNQYEKLILAGLRTYPSESIFEAKRRALHAEVGLFPLHFLHRLFKTGVPVSDSRHQAHQHYLAINEERKRTHELVDIEMNTIESSILDIRKSSFVGNLKLANDHSYWQTLTGVSFERELYMLLMRHGVEVVHVGGRGDEGADLIVRSRGKKVVVQCKAYNKAVGPGPVRDLLGALLHHQADEAWLVSLEGFSDAAIKFAAGKRIKLIPISAFLGAKGKTFVSGVIES
jgi:hypothetical protein